MPLVVTRRNEESIQIGTNVTITVLHTRNGRCKLLVDAPREIPITRTGNLTRPATQPAEVTSHH